MNSLIKFFAIVLIALLLAANTGAQEISRGQVVEKIVQLEAKDQNYALYLPANYSPEKKWPVIYLFDPDGEGAPPTEIFQKAAEKYGFIIIGSNNSQNGIGSATQSTVIKALWKDTHARFAIDPQRTYAAGYSGGARVANNFAYSCKGCIAGVISCGASFPPEFPLGKDLPYLIHSTTGFNDFNYPEMVRLDRALAKLGLQHNLGKFDGGHEWLTESLTFDVIEWFNLQAMKNGRLAKGDAFIKDSFTRRETEADKLFSDGRFLDTYNKYDSIARDFAGLIDDRGVIEKRDHIAKSKEYKDALKSEEEMFDRQTATVRHVVDRAHDFLNPDEEQNAVREISIEMTKMRATAKAEIDSDERRFARRTLHAILAEANESGMYIYMQKKDYKSAAANFELASLVNLNPYIEINLARALILDGRKKEAIEALNRSVEKGLKDCGAITGNEAFSSLETNKGFQKLLVTMKCAGPE